MTTTLTQVSDVFNLLCQLDARIFNYHFGWQWDINKEIDNNFDVGNKTGRLFPAVQMDVPDYFQALEQPSYEGTKEEIKVLLYFYDEQDYNNDSSSKTINLIEQWTNLKTIAEDFVANYLEAIGPKKYNIGFISNPRYTQRSNLHNDRLIVWEVEFILTHIAPCTVESSKINLGLLPNILQASDIEREVLTCSSILLNGVNQYIKLPISSAFNIARTDKVSFECVFKLNSIGSYNFFFAKQTSTRGFWLGVAPSGQLTMSMQNNGGINGFFIESLLAPISVGTWHIATITYNGSSFASGVKFYLDGVLYANGIPLADSLTATIQNTVYLTIGANPTFGLYADMFVNITRAWNVELNATEVQQEFDILQDYFQDPTSLPSAVKESSLIVSSLNGSNAVFDGDEYQIQDLTGITTGYETINCEEVSLVQDCP